jgi:hypothetical protein
MDTGSTRLLLCDEVHGRLPHDRFEQSSLCFQ